ncbi:hypothetical protein GBA52_024863 [Prunus armeniaca]|nr:hypothetical protein GBA52_024863 [Prunus armeniaca]
MVILLFHFCEFTFLLLEFGLKAILVNVISIFSISSLYLHSLTNQVSIFSISSLYLHSLTNQVTHLSILDSFRAIQHAPEKRKQRKPRNKNGSSDGINAENASQAHRDGFLHPPLPSAPTLL